MADTYCLECGRKNCPKISWCPRVALEKEDKAPVRTREQQQDYGARRRYYAREAR